MECIADYFDGWCIGIFPKGNLGCFYVYTNADILVRTISQREFQKCKLEVVKIDGKFYVKKTYKTPLLDYMQREILARETLPNDERISPIVKTGLNYIIVPYNVGGTRF